MLEVSEVLSQERYSEEFLLCDVWDYYVLPYLQKIFSKGLYYSLS
jgi:hypothetical protein